MATLLSPAKLSKARRGFNIFNILNSFSFVFLSGSFITLYAMRLGASKAMIGVLNALGYATFFFLPLGKRFLKKKPIIWVFGWAWVGRYSAMLPVLFAPLLSAAGHPGAAVGLVLAGVAGFSLFRGIAMIGNNPVLDYLASGGGDKARADRGAYMVNISIINSISAMIAGLALSVVLGENASPWIYAGAIGFGIAVGYAGCIFLLQTPEPAGYKSDEAGPLMASVKEAFKEPSFKRFIEVFVILAFVGGMGRSFLPVYAKDVFLQGDDAIMIYALLGSLGSVAMGLIMRLVVDRLGSKPLFVINTCVALFSIAPMAFIPGGGKILHSPASIALFLSFVHFLASFGFAGEESSGQTYFFSIVPKEKTLNMGVIYYCAYGFGGAMGSGLGGVALDLLSRFNVGQSGTYRLFYAILSLALVYAIIRMRSLKKLGSASVAQSLGVMFSPRDLRAFDLLAKLDRSEDPGEEARLIHEIGESASTLSQSELGAYLRSPRFEVRMEALLALEHMPVLDKRLERPLIHEVERHVFTTAYVAARVLGGHSVLDALPILRKAVDAEDYMLQGTAMMALAKMHDRDSVPLIEAVLMRASNPRVRISAAAALELLGSRGSLPALASCLRYDDPPAFVSDELVISMASILGFMGSFYPLYSSFIEVESQGIAFLRAAAADAMAGSERHRAWEKALTELFATDKPDGRAMAAYVMDVGMDSAAELVLADALMDPALAYRGLRFLAAAYPLLATAIPDAENNG